MADTLHFRRAAEQLHLTPSALTQQVQRLEREVGGALLHRTSRAVRLTPAGCALRDRAVELIAAADQALGEVRRVVRGERNAVTLGFHCTLLASLLAPLATAVTDGHAGLRFSVVDLPAAAPLGPVLDGAVDVAFLRTPVDHPAVVARTVLVEPVVVALPDGHPLAGLDGVDLADLAGDRWWLTPRPGGDHRQDFLDRCRARGFTPNVVGENASLQANLGLVAAGLGVLPLPSSARAISPAGVSFVPVQGWSASTLAVHRRDSPPPSLAVVLEAARRVAATSPPLRSGGSTPVAVGAT